MSSFSESKNLKYCLYVVDIHRDDHKLLAQKKTNKQKNPHRHEEIVGIWQIILSLATFRKLNVSFVIDVLAIRERPLLAQ